MSRAKNFLLESILKRHKGKDNAITSSELTSLTGLSGGEIRERVNMLRRIGRPVCSGTTGYYWTQSIRELDACTKQLQSRIDGISAAKEGLESAIEEMRERNRQRRKKRQK